MILCLFVLILLHSKCYGWLSGHRRLTSLTRTFISTPSGPFDKDYVDERIDNRLNYVVNKISDKIDSNAKEMTLKIDSNAKEMTLKIEAIRKENSDTVKEIMLAVEAIKKDNLETKTLITVGINTASAVGVVLGIFGIANFGNLIDVIKSWFKL